MNEDVRNEKYRDEVMHKRNTSTRAEPYRTFCGTNTSHRCGMHGIYPDLDNSHQWIRLYVFKCYKHVYDYSTMPTPYLMLKGSEIKDFKKFDEELQEITDCPYDSPADCQDFMEEFARKHIICTEDEPKANANDNHSQ